MPAGGSDMMGAAIGLVIVAALGGQQFTVWSIVPAGLLVAACATLAVDQTVQSLLMQVLIVYCALQLGFFLGAALRFVAGGTTVRKPLRTSSNLTSV